jgi:hypothetical protein
MFLKAAKAKLTPRYVCMYSPQKYLEKTEFQAWILSNVWIEL